ncbi:transcription factor bHLH123-like [Punica granatum]|uniref:BHLH domain-containing protein n=2 Tax=Punica granatum TaxID=22663 RepID=A0A218X8V7_PUNGR|nr:transcription factor bHLH123-like [Punica granatum]OWM81218.1 hypothetical protein CDL15_Pgr007249 [Punica granatum]PKI51133.1 hypothetical protein CRG98_028420 [Punica granatum]
MAEEFGASGNMWDLSSSRNRFESGASSTSSSGLTSIGGFGWLTDMGDMKPRSSIDHSSPNISISSSGSGVTSAGFHHHHDAHNKLSLGAESTSSSNLAETSLHMMNLGLSSQAIDWNQQQPLLRGDKAADSSFRSMLQDNMSSNANFQEDAGTGSGQVQWRSENYMLHGILGSDNQHQHSGFENRPVNNSYPNYATANYGLSTNDQHPDHQFLPSNWSKVPQFLRNSPRKQLPQPHGTGQLHFSNNAPFWNATSGAAAVTDVRPSFFPPVQAQFPTPSFDEKPKNLLERGDSATTTKKSGGEGANKRPRSESTQSPLPAFKVRKEKMGDRITALQQLVSPFGKTDTASVLSEAIEYIKFLHEQVSALSSPYMKTGAIQQHHHHQHHQNTDKLKVDPEGPRQDLRSRGLCLVPLSSTFHVTSHETSLEFWNPTFGGTFR